MSIDVGIPLEHRTMATEVSNRLREMILTGHLPAGTRLHQEDLSAALGVSRTPLRQALGLLVEEGFVRRSRASQYTVAAIDKVNLGELYLVRREIDGLAAELAAQRRTPEDLRRIDTELKAMEHADPHKWLQHHRAFHVAIYQTARNEHLLRFLPVVELSSQLYYPQLMASVDRRAQSDREHLSIRDAIAAQDLGKARQEAKLHIEQAMALLK